MKFFLAQGASIVATTVTTFAHNKGSRRLSAKITPKEIIPCDEGEGNLTPVFVKKLQALRQRVNSLQNEGNRSWLSLDILFNACDAPDSQTVGVQVLAGPLINALSDLFGQNVKLQITICDFTVEHVGVIGTVKSSEMTVNSSGDYACLDPSFFKAEYWQLNVMHNRFLHGTLVVTASVAYADLNAESELGTSDKLNKKMLLEEVWCDLVIVLENGVNVKAHVSVLAAHSPVINAMLHEADMEETKRMHTVQMSDMSEESVRAMLAYLYYWEDLEPNSKPMVAFEMLVAGRKYDIPKLESAMKELLLTKPDDWYNVDVAIRLFLFANGLEEDGEDLKAKAIHVLKKSRANLKDSPICVALFREDPDAALDLCQCLKAFQEITEVDDIN